jgi:hypothetical protein
MGFTIERLYYTIDDSMSNSSYPIMHNHSGTRNNRKDK